MARVLLVISCLAVAASAQPFFAFQGSSFPSFSSPFSGGSLFGNGLFSRPSQAAGNSSSPSPSAFTSFAASGLHFGLNSAGSGLNAVSSVVGQVPVFGGKLSSVANFAKQGLGTVGTFGLGGLQAVESSRQSIISSAPGTASVSSSSSSSSSTQSGNNPPQTVSSSFSSVSST